MQRQMRAHAHPRPFAHAEMRVVGQRANGIQPRLQIQRGLRADHEAGPATHGIGSVALALCNPIRAQFVQQHCTDAGHALEDAQRASDIDGLQRRGRQAGKHGSHQHGLIERHTFGQRGALHLAARQGV